MEDSRGEVQLCKAILQRKRFTYKNMSDINRRSGLQTLSSSLPLVPLRRIFPFAFLVTSFGVVLWGHP